MAPLVVTCRILTLKVMMLKKIGISTEVVMLSLQVQFILVGGLEHNVDS